MAGHRYWRLNVSATSQGTNSVVVELQLRTVAGGASVATGGTASASSTSTTYVASNAFDGSTSSYWMSGGVAPQQLAYDFGSGVTENIVQYAQYDLSLTSGSAYQPISWTLEYSDDAATWTVADTQTNVPLFPVGGYAVWSVPQPVTAISGSTALPLSVTGKLGGHAAIAGSTAIGFATTGTLSKLALIAGSVAMSLSAAGTLGSVHAISGSVAMPISVTGALTPLTGIAGSTAMPLSATGTISGKAAISGSTTLPLSVRGTLAGQAAISGALAWKFTTTGTLAQLVVIAPLKGAVSVALHTTGTITALTPVQFSKLFASVYTTRQTLLDAIYAAAQVLANNAQGTANAADPAKIVNPNFTQVLTGWTPDAANEGWYGETGVNSPAPLLTTYAVHAGSTVNPPNTTATATTALRNNAFAPITPGEVFTAAVQIKPVSTPDGYANARVSWRNASQAEISVSQGNSITNATGTGTSRVSATAPAGAVYAHAEVAAYNHTVGYYSFTAASWSYQPTNQSEVPNGGGHNSVTAIDTNGLALIDFTQAGHVSKNLDNIGEGKIYVRSMQQVASGAAWIIDNALFQQWDNGANTTVPGWIAQSGCAVSVNGSSQIYGTYCLELVTTSGAANYATSAKQFFVKPGDKLSLNGLVNPVSGAGTDIAVNFYTSAGTYISQIVTTLVTVVGWTSVGASGVVPNGAAYAVITLQSAGGGAYHSLFQFVQVTVNDIRVAGSGAQVGDQRNLPPILTAGAQAVWQNLTISATTAAGTPATATISVSAAQIIGALASSGLVSYNASSAGTTGTGGTQYTYYLYYLDQTLAGGTLTLQVTTTPNDLRAQLGVVYIGSITFTYPTSGTGTGSGVSGLCVCDGMFIDDETTAIEARPGHLFDCLDIPTQGMRKFRRRLQSVDYGTVPCVRITTDAGAVLECSTTTPFDVLDGRTVLAPMMLGEQVVTDEGIQTVARVDDIGEQRVCHIHLGGVSYAAGADPEHRIYSHNVKP